MTKKEFLLALPQEIISYHMNELFKLKFTPEKPQCTYDQFDGDERKTKFWVEVEEESCVLWAHYEGKPFNQRVISAAEASKIAAADDTQPTGLKGKLLELFRDIGCDPEDALNNACILANKLRGEEAPAKRMLLMFVYMVDNGIKIDKCRILENGIVVLDVKDEFKSKMERITNRTLGENTEEVNEDPRVDEY